MRTDHFSDGLLRGVPGTLGVYLRVHDPAAPDYLSRLVLMAGHYSANAPLAIHESQEGHAPERFSLVKPAPATVGKMLQSLGSRHGEASNPHFRLMPPNDLTEGDRAIAKFW